jgi:hypothetical protein
MQSFNAYLVIPFCGLQGMSSVIREINFFVTATFLKTNNMTEGCLIDLNETGHLTVVEVGL